MRERKTLIAFLLALCMVANYASGVAPKPQSEEQHAEENLTASEILKRCAEMIPLEKLLLQGKLTVRKMRGIVLSETPYKLLMDWGAKPPTAEVLLLDPRGTSLVERAILTRGIGERAQIKLFQGYGEEEADPPTFASRIRGTDMTWLDLTLDFLWWKHVRFDDQPRGSSRNGRDCDILVATPDVPIPGCAAVRIWVDRQLRCMVQAEQLGPQGDPVRQMWVRRVKRTDDRWMIRDMEIESLGSGHRTRLSVDDVSEP